jgi:hypothetical protein
MMATRRLIRQSFHDSGETQCACRHNKKIAVMREAGARDVHFCIASPPITHPDSTASTSPTAGAFFSQICAGIALTERV